MIYSHSGLGSIHIDEFQFMCIYEVSILVEFRIVLVQSCLAITRLAITRIRYNAVGRGPRISAARGEMGATANNNAVINCHLFLCEVLMFVLYRCI